ncbi:hypothetical protein AALP_AA1G195100 [Arabis alpina]|uniref:TIR domain-containing protein n=1 Tax=Arabis alpina TaxID=50452 RepID=A0A087HP93_ARAAL|nr:hypothetical protein AALP_AA1G195100 [Arabis alpina]
MSMSVPSSSSSTQEFSVFLSFQGQEIRRTFVSHLRCSLERRGITTHEDEKGKLDPSEVDRLLESQKFWDFTIQKRENSAKVLTWREALSQLADIPGSQHSEIWKGDAELISKITDDIWGMLIGSKSIDLCGLLISRSGKYDDASSSRSVRPDHRSDNRGLAIMEVGDRGADDRAISARDLLTEEGDREVDERDPSEGGFSDHEEIDGDVSPLFECDLPVGIKSPCPGLSRGLLRRGNDDIASSSSYETLEKIRGDDDWSGVDIRIPRPHERPWTPPKDFMCLYECYFSHGGMWFPTPRLVLEYCEVRRVAPSQLTCASYRNICAILTMAAELGRSVNLAQLEEMMVIAKSVLEPVPKGAFSLIDELKKLGQQKWGDFIEQRIKRCRRCVTSGNFTIPLAKIMPYTNKPLKDRKPRPTKKQSLETADMGIEDLDVVVYNVGSASAKDLVRSDARKKDKGIATEDSTEKMVGAADLRKPAETSEGSALVGDRGEVRRSEKKRDREVDRARLESDPKKRKKEDRMKDKALAIPTVADADDRNPADHILEDPASCGEYARCIQGHPRGPVSVSEEMVERDEFLAFSVDLVRMVSNVNFMRTRYEQMLQKNHGLIMENRALKSKMKNMTKNVEEMVGHINTLGQKNKELKVEVSKWEDETRRQQILGNTELRDKVGAQLQRLRRHISDSKEMNRISSTVGQIKAFIAFYEEQGSAPEGAVEKLKADLDEYLRMAAAHKVEKISEQDFVFPDRSSWNPGDEFVFDVESPNRAGQYGMGEEWDSAEEEEVRGGGEVDIRPYRVTLKVGGSDPTASLHVREGEDGSGSSHVSETDDDLPKADDRTEVVKNPTEVAGPSAGVAGDPSTVADPARSPDEHTENPETPDVDVVNF